MEDLDGTRGRTQIDLLPDQRMRHRVEEGVELDVVVEVHPHQLPLGELVIFLWQGRQCRALDGLEQVAAADAKMTHDLPVQPLQHPQDRLVGFVEREERHVPQSAEDVGLGQTHPGFDHRLVPRLARARRQHADTVMRRHHAVATIELRVVERCLVDPGLEIIRDQEPGHAVVEAEHPHMGADPVRQRLRPYHFGVGVVRGAEHRHEDLRLPDLASRAVDDRELLAREVDEHFVAGHMLLPHHRRQMPFEGAVQVTPAAVAVPLGMDLAVLAPEDLERHARTLQLAGDHGPVRLRSAASPKLAAGRPAEQPLFKNGVGRVIRQRPAQSGCPGALQVVPDRTARHVERRCNLTAAAAAPGKPKHLSYLSHGQLSWGGHTRLLGIEEVTLPRRLTQRKTPLAPGEFKSERWAVSSRNGGRLQIGISGRIPSEFSI